MKIKCGAKHGSVLIMVLWALTLLTVFAIQIAAMTQDKISFLARAERYSLLRNAAKSGIFKALAIIRDDRFNNTEHNLLQRSLSLFYNPTSFRDLSFGQATTSVFYRTGEDLEKVYGVSDEAQRLNVNFADRETIRKLILLTAGATEDQADKIATGIYDWREFGESEINGFSSDNFYENLQFPYQQKKAKFETLDELKLVEGMSEQIYERLIDWVTIYGDGDYNINSVTWPVLMALGFSEQQAKMVETLRRGADGLAGTLDDVFFIDRNMMIGNIIEVLAMKPQEAEAFRKVAEAIAFVQEANIFRVQSHAAMAARKENTSITCVFNGNDDKILYWQEN